MEECKEKEISQLMVDCDCGCSIIRIGRYEWKDGLTEYGISLYKANYYYESEGIVRRIFKRLKNTWFTFIGKEYPLFGILISENRFDEFRKNINSI